MKNILILLFSALALPSVAQQFPLSVLAVSGYEGSTADGNFTVSSTLGETVMITMKGAGGTLTQGFHQGDRQRCWTLPSEYPADIQFDAGGFDPCQTTNVSLTQLPFDGFEAQWFLNGLPVCDGWSCIGVIDTGVNTFALLLSSDGCELYGTDTLILNKGLAAAPQNDLIEVLQGAPNAQIINLIQNDDNVEPGFTLDIQNPAPDVISVTEIPQTPGAFFVSAGPRAQGDYNLSYRICNTGFCTECQTATLTVKVNRLLGEGYNNGITPNGDGLNDVFVLCQPCTGCDPCTDMQVWIYNRWGDLVFEDKEYDNDWQGLNENGKELPAGTYFYYARINNEFRTGTITIIR
jgi:gliding motility-associated-like protein